MALRASLLLFRCRLLGIGKNFLVVYVCLYVCLCVAILSLNNSLIKPLFDNCDVVWDNTSNTLKFQNRAGGIISQEGYDILFNEVRN